jgi:hypothetical protein
VAYLLYQDHTIVSSAVYDDVSGKWKLTACVSWQGTDNKDRFHFLRNSPELFSRSEDAEKAGLEAGKYWIESKAKQNVAS